MSLAERGIGELDPHGSFAENDNVDWINPEDMALPEDLPRTALWRILVLPVQPKTKSKGGLIIPVQAQDAEGHLQVIGKIAALGPLAYRSWKYAQGLRDYWRIATGRRVSWAPKVGDWVIYGRYTGQRMEYRNTRLILMNDDEILGQVDSPDGFRIYT